MQKKRSEAEVKIAAIFKGTNRPIEGLVKLVEAGNISIYDITKLKGVLSEQNGKLNKKGVEGFVLSASLLKDCFNAGMKASDIVNTFNSAGKGQKVAQLKAAIKKSSVKKVKKSSVISDIEPDVSTRYNITQNGKEYSIPLDDNVHFTKNGITYSIPLDNDVYAARKEQVEQLLPKIKETLPKKYKKFMKGFKTSNKINEAEDKLQSMLDQIQWDANNNHDKLAELVQKGYSLKQLMTLADHQYFKGVTSEGFKTFLGMKSKPKITTKLSKSENLMQKLGLDNIQQNVGMHNAIYDKPILEGESSYGNYSEPLMNDQKSGDRNARDTSFKHPSGERIVYNFQDSNEYILPQDAIIFQVTPSYVQPQDALPKEYAQMNKGQKGLASQMVENITPQIPNKDGRGELVDLEVNVGPRTSDNKLPVGDGAKRSASIKLDDDGGASSNTPT